MSSPENTDNPQPKPKRKRTIYRKPLKVITITGQEQVFGDTFNDTLKASEEDILRTFDDLFDSPDAGAAVTAAAKLLDALEDKGTPERMRDKLERKKQEALDTLVRVSKGAELKPSARAQANAQLMKVMKQSGESAWPPDTSKKEWVERMARAQELCAV